MRKPKDLTGQIFGKLKVVEQVAAIKGRAAWRCFCDCGNETIKLGRYLLNGDTRSCGCVNGCPRGIAWTQFYENIACSIEGCTNKPVAKNLCRPHYSTQYAWIKRPDRKGTTGKCERCGKSFIRNRAGHRFCGLDCLYKQREKNTGRRQALRKYNLTQERYDAILESQNGGCAVCGGQNDGKKMFIDHDHGCCPQDAKSCGGCIRGLLCHFCNSGIGWFRDNTSFMRSAIEYLEKYQSQNTSVPAQSATL
jgi:hypothetical protein